MTGVQRRIRRPRLEGSSLHARYSVSRIVTDDVVYRYHDAYLIPINEHQAIVIDRVAGEFMEVDTMRGWSPLRRYSQVFELFYSIILPTHQDRAIIGHFSHTCVDTNFNGRVLFRDSVRLFAEYPVSKVFPGLNTREVVLQFEE